MKKKKKKSKLLSSIYGVLSVGIYWANNKFHLLDDCYVWVPKTRDFIEDSSEEFGKSKVWV